MAEKQVPEKGGKALLNPPVRAIFYRQTRALSLPLLLFPLTPNLSREGEEVKEER